MGTEQASLSSRIGGTAKIIVSLSDELKHVLTILAVTASFTEVYNLIWKGIPHEAENALIWTAVAYASLFSVLRYAFGRVTGETGSALAVSVSALLFAFLFRGRELAGAAEGTGEAITACLTVGMIAIPVYLLWLMLKLWKDNTFKYLAICILTDTAMICSYFMGEINELPDITGKAVFASLFVLSAALILSITGYFMSDNVSGSPKSSFMDGRPYPFTYFIIIFACLIIIPVRKGPINWNPVIEAGRSIVYKTKRMAESASYYFSSMHESSGYQTGYSSFDQTGASIRPNDRIEVELKTKDSTTFKYRDETDGRDLVRRKVIYLKGGKGTEKGALLDKLFSLYAGGVDSEEASLFASKSSVDISYIYLRTEDEILPLCPLKLTDKDGHPLETDDQMHGKGYNIHADYLDLDYGSPYLERLIASPVTSVNRSDVSYDEIASYAYKAMGIRLNEAVGEDEFISWQAGRTTPGKEYLDTSGASDRMKKLAEQITADCTGDYEKCKAVEAYLRQYAYSMDTAENGYNTGSAEGMSRLAEDFLFENGKGYCVHFASSMVMLLRLNGIPAEFARGYRYIFPFDRQEVYDIKGSDAHAWPEAYVQGFGWISFEPTSIMSNASDRTWHRQPAAEEADKYYTAYKYNGEIPVPAAALASQVNPYDRPDENVDEAARINRNRGILLETARIAFITIFTVIIMIALIIGGSRLYKIISYRRTDDNGRLKRDVEDIIGYIRSVSGCAFEDRGVISDYEAFIPEKYKPEVTEAFGIYYRIKYRCTGEEDNGEKVTVQEGTKVRELRKTLLQRKKKDREDNMRLLIAEDEVSTAKALKVLLEKAKYSVDIVHNGNDAWDYIKEGAYEVIVLDIMMPGMSGLEVLSLIRKNRMSTPVLLLTAKAEIEDRVAGLDAGADDYLPKPFATSELIARVKALGRRSENYNDSVQNIGNIVLDSNKYEMSTGEKTVKLTNKEFQLMELFVLHPGHVFSTDHLMEKIWGYDSESDVDVVWTHIGFVRKKLRQLDANVEIKTMRGAGYALEVIS